MIKSVVISGHPAVGKTTVAKALSAEFDLEYVSGGDVLKELATSKGYKIDGDDWWDTPEGMQFLDYRTSHLEFDKQIDEQLVGLFSKGGVVLTSYTLPWLVKDGIKIWLSGSHENSAKRMQTRDGINYNDALNITRQRLEKNQKLYRKLYNFDYDYDKDPSVFNIKIDTDNLDANMVIELAKSSVRKLL